MVQTVASCSLPALLTNYIYQTRKEKHVTKVTIKCFQEKFETHKKCRDYK